MRKMFSEKQIEKLAEEKFEEKLADVKYETYTITKTGSFDNFFLSAGAKEFLLKHRLVKVKLLYEGSTNQWTDLLDCLLPVEVDGKYDVQMNYNEFKAPAYIAWATTKTGFIKVSLSSVIGTISFIQSNGNTINLNRTTYPNTIKLTLEAII